MESFVWTAVNWIRLKLYVLSNKYIETGYAFAYEYQAQAKYRHSFHALRLIR